MRDTSCPLWVKSRHLQCKSGALFWLLGVPLPIIILLALFGTTRR